MNAILFPMLIELQFFPPKKRKTSVEIKFDFYRRDGYNGFI